MAEEKTIEQRNRTELLFAIRMNWLLWLSKPIQLLWFVIAEAAIAAWRLIVISFTALKGCYDRLLLKRSAIGGSIFFAVLMLGLYVAGLTQSPAALPVALAISVLPLAWTIGEATAITRARQLSEQTPADVPMGNGMTVASTMAFYVVAIAAAVAGQALISMLMSIPGIGPILLGVILIPNVMLSVLIVLGSILLSFGIMVLPSHLLEEQKPSGSNPLKRFLQLNRKLLTILRGHAYWVQLLIIVPFAAAFAIAAAIPAMLLLGASTGLSVAVMTTVTYFSETAQQSLMGLGEVLSGSFMLETLPVSVKIGLLFIVLAFSVILGAAFSPLFGSLAAIYYKLYSRRSDGKTWTFIVLIPIVLLIGLILFAAVAALLQSFGVYL